MIGERQSNVTTADIVFTFMKAQAPLSVNDLCPTNALNVNRQSPYCFNSGYAIMSSVAQLLTNKNHINTSLTFAEV